MEEKEDRKITCVNKTKKKIKIISDAFPPKSKFEGKKIQSTYSNIHKFLIEEKIEINQTMIKLRKIVKEDIRQIRPLFKEWFPLDYDDSFYEKIFLQQDNQNGLSLIAYIENPKFHKKENASETYPGNINNNSINIHNNDDNNDEKLNNFYELQHLILGVIITNKDPLENFIKKIPYKFDNLSYLDELTFETKYFNYVLSLGVIDECRRLRIGSLILNEIIRISNMDYNCLGIFLHVVVYNLTAIKFYEKHHFEEINHLYNYYYIEGNYYDSKVMGRLFHNHEKTLNRNILIRFFEIILINPIKILVLLFTLFFCCRRCRHIKKFKKQ